MNETFSKKLNIIKLILTICVVYIHSNNVTIYPFEQWNDTGANIVFALEKLTGNLLGVCVPFFFLASGYLFYRNWSWKELGRKYKSRVFSLLIPYVVWVTIAYLFNVVITHVPVIAGHLNRTVVDFDAKTWVLGILRTDFNGPLWYMAVLIVYVVINPLIYVVLKNWGGTKIYTGLIVLVGLIGANFLWSNQFYQIAYFVGAYVGINHKKLPFIQRKTIRIIALVCVIISGVVIALDIFSNSGLNACVKVIFGIALWYSVCISENTRQSKLIEMSFFIYAGHSLLLESIEKLFLIVAGKTPMAALIDYLCAPILCIFILIGTATLLKKVKPVWKALTGCR